MVKKLKYILVWAIVTGNVACSYVADYIEGEFTNRASFSINVYYQDGTGVIVQWDVNPASNSFAGYEIYMTKEPNNEFADMIVVGAPYDIGSSYFITNVSLEHISTQSFTHNTSSLPPSGIYFYRVGVIEWDERDYDGDGKDDSKPNLPSVSLYESYTSIAEISGSAIVTIP